MNVKELKDYLNTLPEDMEIDTIYGYEGYDDCDHYVNVNEVSLNDNLLTIDKINNTITIGKYVYET